MFSRPAGPSHPLRVNTLQHDLDDDAVDSRLSSQLFASFFLQVTWHQTGRCSSAVRIVIAVV